MSRLIALGLAGFLFHSPSTLNSAGITGQVFDASTRNPIPAAEVQLIPDEGRTQPVGRPDRSTFATTDRSGQYSFQASGPGDTASTPITLAAGETVVPLEIRIIGARTDTAGRPTLAGLTSGTYNLLAVPPVVIAVSPNRGMGLISGGISGTVSSGGVTTETADGITTEFRDANGTRIPITVSQANITGLAVAVPRPTR